MEPGCIIALRSLTTVCHFAAFRKRSDGIVENYIISTDVFVGCIFVQIFLVFF